MKSPQELHRVVLVANVVLRRGDDKLLLMRRARGGYHDGEYCLPGGNVGEAGDEGRETATHAAIRELKEETGVDVALEDLRLVHVMHRYSKEPEPHERLDLTFEATRWHGEPTNVEPEKCDDLGWFSAFQVPKKTIPEVRQVLEMIAEGKLYSDHNF